MSQRGHIYADMDDSTSMSIELPRTVPMRAGEAKETETLSDVDYFKMDDLFKKDRARFLGQSKRSRVEDTTNRFKNTTYKIIEELPDSVASKYGNLLTELVNSFVEEHAALKDQLDAALSRNSENGGNAKSPEQALVIGKLSEKLSKYKNQSLVLKDQLKEKDRIIAELQRKVQTAVQDGIPVTKEQLSKLPVSPQPNEIKLSLYDESPDYSYLIDELKTGLSKIELEEELRLKKELQAKEYQILKKQLEDLQIERERKNKQVQNRDLDQFKLDLKNELGELFGRKEAVETTAHNKSADLEEDQMLAKIRSILVDNNQELEARFKELVANKAGREELKAVLLKFDALVAQTKALSEAKTALPTRCPHCSKQESDTHDRGRKMVELKDRMAYVDAEIMRIENAEKFDQSRIAELMGERHSLKKKLEKFSPWDKVKMESDEEDFDTKNVSTDDQQDESNNCHTLNKVRSNTRRFGIASIKRN